jgi:hypothetical protein
MKKWPAYIPSYAFLESLSKDQLMKDSGLNGVKFTKIEIVSRLHWQFGPDGILSPPEGAYKDKYDD